MFLKSSKQTKTNASKHKHGNYRMHYIIGLCHFIHCAKCFFCFDKIGDLQNSIISTTCSMANIKRPKS